MFMTWAQMADSVDHDPMMKKSDGTEEQNASKNDRREQSGAHIELVQ